MTEVRQVFSFGTFALGVVVLVAVGLSVLVFLVFWLNARRRQQELEEALERERQWMWRNPAPPPTNSTRYAQPGKPWQVHPYPVDGEKENNPAPPHTGVK